MHTPTQVPVGEGHLAVYRDRPPGGGRRCLLVPPYGLPAAALAPVAHALVDHGHEVIRFDGRDHVGAGSGTIADFRMSRVAVDCAELIERFQPSVVVAISLGARAALRALAETRSAADAVFVTPVVDVRNTLRAVLDRDWFEVPTAEVPELVPVLDHDIRADQFLRDCEAHGLVEPAGTVIDLQHTGGRVTLIPGSHDPWVDRAMVERIVSQATTADDPTRFDVRVQAADSHALHEDAELAMRMISAALDAVRTLADGTRRAS
ncbi:MAG: alpha/beta fold hydrolase [Actinomycetota bacterium]